MGSGGGNNACHKISTSSSAYGEAWYWDRRYAESSDDHFSTFDWYQKYPSLAPLIRLYVHSLEQPILVVGCGNSEFSKGMVEDGYRCVINVDISSVVIQAMQKKHVDLPQLKYIQMDVRDMSAFDTGAFLAVIDKGTLDSLLCGRNSLQKAAKMLGEVYRVLKDKGVYILITYGSPIYRLPLLKELSWTVKLHVIEKFPSSTSKHPIKNLTSPVRLENDGSSPEDGVEKNSDVHYIYVCLKVS